MICWDWTKAIALPREASGPAVDAARGQPWSGARCPRPQSPHVRYCCNNQISSGWINLLSRVSTDYAPQKKPSRCDADPRPIFANSDAFGCPRPETGENILGSSNCLYQLHKEKPIAVIGNCRQRGTVSYGFSAMSFSDAISGFNRECFGITPTKHGVFREAN